jgi:3-oxoacyl-[acyl-carrier protein] reductase
MQIDLTGRVALVTGGSRGIGRACAIALGGAGAHVVLTYLKAEHKAEEVRAALTTLGVRAEIFRIDMADTDAVAALFETVQRRFARLDVLVNNAGIIKDSLLLSMETGNWDRVHAVNLRGPFLATRHAVEMMMPQHAGRIINIASVGAIAGGRGQTNYAASKGGLVAFTRACAVELAGKGILVNAVLPGMIVTEMSERARKRAGSALLERIPLGRCGDPEDVARLVLFLASDLSAYITGQAICVDGGLSAQ